MSSVTLKDKERYILSLNDKLYLRKEINGKFIFTDSYEYAFKTERILEIEKLQRDFGGKVFILKELIYANEIEV